MEDEDEGFGRARRDDPETAHEAARHNRIPLRMLVLRVYRDAGEHGCTMDEVFERLQGQWPASISPRSHELLSRGLIENTDERRVTRRGMEAGVRRITAAGVDALREAAV